MAKILVVGSRKEHDAAEFGAAGRAIGDALAKHGHTIVAAGCGDEDAETWVLDGANSAAASDKKIKVVPFSPAVPGTQDLLQEAVPCLHQRRRDARRCAAGDLHELAQVLGAGGKAGVQKPAELRLRSAAERRAMHLKTHATGSGAIRQNQRRS